MKMDARRIIDMEANEFNKLLEDFIERETAEMGEIDAPLFYETIERIYEPVATATHITSCAPTHIAPWEC